MPALHPPACPPVPHRLRPQGTWAQTHPARDRQTDRQTARQTDAAAAPSLNREVKKLNKLKQQINNTDLGQPAASGSSSTRARTGTQAREHLQRRAGGTGCQLASAWVPRCRWTGEGVLQKERAEERLQAPSARLSDASPTTAPPWRQPGRQDLPRALVTASLSAGWRQRPLGARSSSPWPCGAETGQSATRAGGRRQWRWAGPRRRARRSSRRGEAGPRQLPSAGRCPARSPEDGLVEVTC